jgi:hypothetical protein
MLFVFKSAKCIYNVYVAHRKTAPYGLDVCVTFEKCSRNNLICRITEGKSKKVWLSSNRHLMLHENMQTQKQLPLNSNQHGNGEVHKPIDLYSILH